MTTKIERLYSTATIAKIAGDTANNITRYLRGERGPHGPLPHYKIGGGKRGGALRVPRSVANRILKEKGAPTFTNRRDLRTVYGVSDLADVLDGTTSWVHSMIREGTIEHVTDEKGRRVVTRAALAKFLDAHRVDPKSRAA
jgi:hypothetical protein